MEHFKNKNFFDALKNAFIGLRYALQHHRHFKIEIIYAVLVIIFSFIMNLNSFEFLFIILSIFFVLFSEIVNTLIEETLNIIEPNYNEKIKILKDISSGAVLVVALFSLIVGILIFGKKLFSPIF